MLLEANEIRVVPGDYRLHDFAIVRVDLRSLDPIPHLKSAIYVHMTLGDIYAPSDRVIKAGTNGFNLSDIEGYQEAHAAWRNDQAKGRCDQGFLDYFLGWLRSHPEVSLEFLFEEGRMEGFSVSLGRQLKLFGRFPEDVDVLSLYFGVAVDEIAD